MTENRRLYKTSCSPTKNKREYLLGCLETCIFNSSEMSEKFENTSINNMVRWLQVTNFTNAQNNTGIWVISLNSKNFLSLDLKVGYIFGLPNCFG